MITSESFRYEEVQAYTFGYSLLGKPSLFVHLYFVDGILIDTGQRKAQRQIMKAVQKLEIEQIFITHHHEDHSGNIKAISTYHDCPVYASEKCCAMMKSPPRISFAQKITWGNRESQQDMIPKADTITTNNYHFQIIPIPGHAPDMVALYEPERKWLFSADLYLNSYIDYFVETESMAQQIKSIKRILELDFKVLFCAHKPQLKHAKQQLNKKLDFLEAFFDQAAALHYQGCPAREIFRNLELKENWLVKILSSGYLSKMNMVKSVLRDLDKG